MRDQMETRLEALRKELKTGQAELEKVQQQQVYLREMMLRISGAIQVLEELLEEDKSARQIETSFDEMQRAFVYPDDASIQRMKKESLPEATGP